VSVIERRRVSRRAGRSAQREYSRQAKRWRRENRKFFLTSGVVVVAVFIGLYVLSHKHVLVFLAGVLAGGLLALYIAIRESPPPWIENYQRGALGEQRTASALAPLLKQGWVVVHDLPRTKSNLDHVLVGPGGVFVLDTKNYRGFARVIGDTLTVTYEDGRGSGYQGDGLARSARAQGREVNEMLRLRGETRVWVSAVVVLWTEFPQQRADGNKMTYIQGGHLVEWLLSQPARLNSRQVDQIAGLLRPGQRRRSNARGDEIRAAVAD
jgi:hypothetical protein